MKIFGIFICLAIILVAIQDYLKSNSPANIVLLILFIFMILILIYKLLKPKKNTNKSKIDVTVHELNTLQETLNIKYPIKYMTNPPSKTFKINELEEKFFNTLYFKLPDEINKSIRLVRLSNGTFNVELKNGFVIGKIKLQGREHFMQILTSLYKHYVINENFIEHIDEWIRYINKYNK